MSITLSEQSLRVVLNSIDGEAYCSALNASNGQSFKKTEQRVSDAIKLAKSISDKEESDLLRQRNELLEAAKGARFVLNNYEYGSLGYHVHNELDTAIKNAEK